jgi:hypothetical protein
MSRVASSIVVCAALLVGCPEQPPPATPPPPATYTQPPPSSTSNAPPPYEHSCPTGLSVKLDRRCSADADCGFVEEQQCCGGHAAVGVRASEAKRAETVCGPLNCGNMGCPAGNLRTDDGNTSRFRDGVAVRCAQGTCSTHGTPGN